MNVSQLSKLGNGVGILLVTDETSLNYIIPGIDNTPDNVQVVKAQALTGAAEGFPISANGGVTFVSITANDTINDFTVDGVRQFDITSPIAISIGAEGDAATALAIAVNNFIPVSGANYKAYVVGSQVILEAPSSFGSSVNGHVVNITVGLPGSQTITETDIGGGGEGGGDISSITGVRVYINATSGAVVGDITAPGTYEITPHMVMQGTQGAITSISQTIASESLTALPRTTQITKIELGASAPTNLNTMSGEFALNDIIVVTNTSAFTVTMQDLSLGTGNLKLNPTSFAMINDDYVMWFMYMEDATDGVVWREINRSHKTIIPDSVTDVELANLSVGTTELQALSVTTPKIALAAIDNTLLAASSVATANIQALAITNAEIGLLAVETANIQALAVTDAELAANSVTTPKILDANVTLAKLETKLTKGFFVVPISFDTGRLGIFEVKVPFDLTVTEVLGSVTELIEATDDKTFIGKDNGGVAWTGGQIDFPGGTVFGNSFTSSPTGNNTYLAGQVFKLETLAVTPGGNVTLTICYTQD